jgi:hypothetical protein
MRISPRSALLSLVAIVAIAGLIGALKGGRKVETSSLSGGKGSVQLVVEFGAASGMRTIDVRVPGFSGTGWQLLELAGFDIEGTADYPNSFVCRLDGWPTRSMESCTSGPSGRTGHWAYFVTNPALGAGWVMSGVGAAAHRAECGQAEAWVWVAPGADTSKTAPKSQPRVFECEQ